MDQPVPTYDELVRENERLRQSYRGLIENSGLGIHISRIGGGRLFVNDAMAILLGYESAKELFDTPKHRLVAAHDRGKSDKFINDAPRLPDGPNVQYECDYSHKNGSTVSCHVLLSKISWDGEDALQRIVIDFSERKRAEQARVESEEHLRAILDNSPSPVYLKDLESRILLINKAYQEKYGVTQEEACGSHGRKWMGRDKFEKFGASDQRIIAGQKSQVVETDELNDQGARVITQTVKFPIRDKAGQVVGIGRITSDVTEHRLTEEKLSQKSDLLQTALNHMAQGIAAYDSDLNLIAFNQIFVDLYKFPPNFVQLGMPYAKVARFLAENGHYGEGDVEELLRDRVRRARGNDQRQFTRVGEDGKSITVWRDPLPGGGFLSSFADVTERAEFEDALNQAKSEAEDSAKQAQMANTAKSNFLAVMSHEIRTPMNAVLGMADIVSGTDLTDQQREYMDILRESGRSLMDLLNDILDLSKIEAGSAEPEKREFSMRDFLTTTQSLWSHAAQDKGLTFSVHNSASESDFVRGDRNRLRQIVTNLVGNAIKFTETGSVELHLAEVSGSETKTELRFEIRDTGIGVSEEQQQNIFDPFIQADSSTTRNYGGTGLGLSICRKLVGLLEGEIGVNSTPGEGSIFWFTISFDRGVAATKQPNAPIEPAATQAIPHDQRALRILVAEDNQLNQQIISWMLTPLGCQIDIVENGLEAVAAITRSRYDLILMDIQMPEMDGVAATERIRSLGGEVGEIPIIAMTANAMFGDREKYLEAGMNGYVSKPIDQREMLSAITGQAKVSMPVFRNNDFSGQSREEETVQALNKDVHDEFDSLMGDLDDLLDGTGNR